MFQTRMQSLTIFSVLVVSTLGGQATAANCCPKAGPCTVVGLGGCSTLIGSAPTSAACSDPEACGKNQLSMSKRVCEKQDHPGFSR